MVEWWDNEYRTRSKREVEGIAAILWEVWRNRNSQVWNNKFQPPLRVVYSAMIMVHRW